jgi:hypothetical protein
MPRTCLGLVTHAYAGIGPGVSRVATAAAEAPTAREAHTGECDLVTTRLGAWWRCTLHGRTIWAGTALAYVNRYQRRDFLCRAYPPFKTSPLSVCRRVVCSSSTERARRCFLQERRCLRDGSRTAPKGPGIDGEPHAQ